MSTELDPAIANFVEFGVDPGQAKFLTCESSDFTPCTHAQSNILHTKYDEKTDY